MIRINSINRLSGLEDLAALAGLENGSDCLLLPKAEQPAQIAAVCQLLQTANARCSVAALIESARGIENTADIAQADAHLSFIMFGAADYAADLGQDVKTLLRRSAWIKRVIAT